MSRCPNGAGQSGLEREIRALGEEGLRVIKDDFLNHFGGVMALLHFKGALDDGEGVRDAPIAGGIHPNIFHSKSFKNIDGTGGRALRFGVKSHAGPVALIKDERSGVFFDVVDDDAVAINVSVVQGVEDEAGSLQFVLEVRGVDEDGKVEFFSKFDVFLEDGELVFGVLVEADFTDAEDVGLVDEVRDEGHHFAGEDGVLGFLGIDAEPAKMLDAKFCSTGWFVFGELTVVVIESLGGRAVETGPESRFAKSLATNLGDGLIVGRGSADHVGMWLDVFHDFSSSL